MMAREMKNSGVRWIGDIPPKWTCQRLKYSLSANDGGIWGEDPKEEGNTIVLRSTEQTIDGKWDIQDPAERYLKSISNYKACLCKEGDLLVTKSSGSKAHIGKTSLVTKEVEDLQCCYSNFLQRLHVQSDRYDKYFWYLLNSNVTRLQFGYRQNDTSGIGNINSADIDSIIVPLPPFVEQKAIADYLDTKCGEIDGLLADLDAEVKTLGEYKKSIIAETVTRGLNPNAPMKEVPLGWIEKLPAHWEIARIASVYSVRNEKVSDQDYQPLSVTMKGIVPQLETAAKTKHGDDRKLIRKGDFIINSRSDRRGSCGISDYDGSCSLINTVLAPREEMNPRYYNWLFHTTSFADEFYKWGYGIVDDLWTTNWAAMRRIQIPVPSLEEQASIAEYLDAKVPQIEKVISDKLTQIETLKAYKSSLIYEYVTGKKQVAL